MRKNFTAVYKKDGGWYIGWIEEIPGTNTQGKTIAELKENLKDALLLIIESNKALNKGSRQKLTRMQLSISL